MKKEEHPRFPCEECDSTTYFLDRAEYVCAQCRTVNRDLVPDFGQPNEEVYVQRNFSLVLGTSQSQMKEKSEKLAAKSSRPWLSVEAAQAILQGILSEVVQNLNLDLTTAERLYQNAWEAWTGYLEARLLVFGKAASFVNMKKRDCEMMKAIKREGFGGVDEKDYNQILYQKEYYGHLNDDFDTYSDGNMTATYLLSDVENEPEISKTEKKKKPKVYEKNSKPITKLDLYALSTIVLRMSGYPVFLWKLIEMSPYEKADRHLPRSINPSTLSVDRWIDQFKVDFKKLRCMIHFIHAQLSPPIGICLEGLETVDNIRAMCTQHVKELINHFKIPEQMGTSIRLVADDILVKSEILRNSDRYAILPHMDVLAAAALYLALITVEFECSEEEQEDWFDSVFFEKDRDRKRTQLIEKIKRPSKPTAKIKHSANTKRKYRKIEKLIQTLPKLLTPDSESEKPVRALPIKKPLKYRKCNAWSGTKEELKKLVSLLPTRRKTVQRTGERLDRVLTERGPIRGRKYYEKIQFTNKLFYRPQDQLETKMIKKFRNNHGYHKSSKTFVTGAIQTIKLKRKLEKSRVAIFIASALDVTLSELAPFIAGLYCE